MKKRLLLLCSLMVALVIAGCTDDEPAKSSEKQLLSFEIKGEQATILENGNSIKLDLTSIVDLTSLAPTISVSDKASISPASGEAKDFTSPVKYTVTAEDGTTAVYTIAVTTVDLATHTPSASPSSTSLGAEGSVTITAEEIEGASYSWYSEESGLLATTTTNEYPVSAPGSYWVVVAFGETMSLKSSTITITPSSTTVAKPEIVLSNATLCSQGSVKISISNMADYPVSTTFEWYKDNVLIDGATGNTYFAAEPGSYAVMVKTADANSEISNAAVVSAGISDKPAISPSAITIPIGGSVILTVDILGESYSWYSQVEGFLGSTTENTYTITSPGSYWVTVEKDGCSSLASDVITIAAVNAVSKPIITRLGTSLCAGGSVELRVQNTVDYPAGTTYTWYKNGNEIAAATSATYHVTTADSYSVVANVDLQSSEESEEEVVKGVVQPILQNPSPIGGGGSVTITIQNTTDYPAGTTFSWYKDGVQIAGNSEASYVATTPGQYFVVAVNNGCQSLASNIVAVTNS